MKRDRAIKAFSGKSEFERERKKALMDLMRHSGRLLVRLEDWYREDEDVVGAAIKQYLLAKKYDLRRPK